MRSRTTILTARLAPALLAAVALTACGSDSGSTSNPGTPGCVSTAETCDGEDNDCDGVADSTDGKTLSRPCDAGGGKEGVQSCLAGQWGQCVTDCVATAETCDGKDNDCDGKADSTGGKALTEKCDANGKLGTKTCVGGTWGECVSDCQATTETCNNKDDDCDGKIDSTDGKAIVEVCDAGGSKVGKKTCTAGTWGTCVADCTPAAETCNNKDDDCDGKVDVDAQDKALTQVCDPGNGKVGTQTCESGAWGKCMCNDPEVETCNGKDDDCDGKVDEDETGVGMTRSCDTACGPGTEVCSGGKWMNCNATVPTTEICNGVDDDCNGKTDDGFDCAKGETASCGTDVGECALGTRVCDGTCKWGQCLGGVVPATEACDGVKDEDCDGTVDNGCSCTNGATKDCCGGTKITCTGGAWPACPTPPVETCNNKDDNCNGLVDDGLPTDPYMLDEDVSLVDDCAHGRIITSTITENGGEYSLTGHLYRKDLAADRDFFEFQTAEISDWLCILNPDYNECYTLKVSLQEPAGTDYQMCLYVLDVPGSGYTCAAPMKKICTTGTSNQINYAIASGCGYEDGYRYFVEVFPAAGSTKSCAPYTLKIDFTGSGPQEATCP